MDIRNATDKKSIRCSKSEKVVGGDFPKKIFESTEYTRYLNGRIEIENRCLDVPFSLL